jgi:hypothetical protein
MAFGAKRAAVIGEPMRGPKKIAYGAAHVLFDTRTLQLMWFETLSLDPPAEFGWWLGGISGRSISS